MAKRIVQDTAGNNYALSDAKLVQMLVDQATGKFLGLGEYGKEIAVDPYFVIPQSLGEAQAKAKSLLNMIAGGSGELGSVERLQRSATRAVWRVRDAEKRT